MLIAQVVARKRDQLFLHFRLCLRCWCAAGFVWTLTFGIWSEIVVKSYLGCGFICLRASCTLSIVKDVFLSFLRVSTVDRYQIIVGSALLGHTGRAAVFPRAVCAGFSSAPLLFAFCVKGALFWLSTPGKALHTGTPKRWHLFVPPVPFILFPLLSWRVTVDFPYLTDLILLFNFVLFCFIHLIGETMVSLTVTLVFPDKRNVIVSVRTSCPSRTKLTETRIRSPRLCFRTVKLSVLNMHVILAASLRVCA